MTTLLITLTGWQIVLLSAIILFLIGASFFLGQIWVTLPEDEVIDHLNVNIKTQDLIKIEPDYTITLYEKPSVEDGYDSVIELGMPYADHEENRQKGWVYICGHPKDLSTTVKQIIMSNLQHYGLIYKSGILKQDIVRLPYEAVGKHRREMWELIIKNQVKYHGYEFRSVKTGVLDVIQTINPYTNVINGRIAQVHTDRAVLTGRQLTTDGQYVDVDISEFSIEKRTWERTSFRLTTLVTPTGKSYEYSFYIGDSSVSIDYHEMSSVNEVKEFVSPFQNIIKIGMLLSFGVGGAKLRVNSFVHNGHYCLIVVNQYDPSVIFMPADHNLGAEIYFHEM